MKTLHYFSVAVLVLGCFLHAPILMAEDSVVAEVNGKPILEVAVWTPVALLELQHPNASGAELTKLDLEGAKKRLQGQVHRILQDEAIESLGIAASPEEIEEATQLRFEEAKKGTGMSLENMLERIQQGQIIVQALREVQQNPEAADVIYEEMLAPEGVDEMTWAYHVAIYHEDPERIDELEANIPASVDEMIEQTRQGVKRELELALLEQHIAEEDVTSADADAEAVQAGYWLEKLEQADVVIYDDNLVEALNDFEDDLTNNL